MSFIGIVKVCNGAINKKIGDLGLKIVYVGENRIEKFTTCVRMLMAFPFILLDDYLFAKKVNMCRI